MNPAVIVATLVGIAAVPSLAFGPETLLREPAPVAEDAVVVAAGATHIPFLAMDGVALPGPGVVVPVPCGDPLVPLGRHHRLPAACRPPELVALPPDRSFEHSGLEPEAHAAALSMLEAAGAEGFEVIVVSAFRSFEEQRRTFEYWVATVGLDQAERTSARPGHSEHQLGTTVDLAAASLGPSLTPAFAETPEGAWVAANAARYGFVMSYPAGGEAVTGYAFEPWHFRFVGTAVAQDLAATGLTLLEYLLARAP